MNVDLMKIKELGKQYEVSSASMVLVQDVQDLLLHSLVAEEVCKLLALVLEDVVEAAVNSMLSECRVELENLKRDFDNEFDRGYEQGLTDQDEEEYEPDA